MEQDEGARTELKELLHPALLQKDLGWRPLNVGPAKALPDKGLMVHSAELSRGPTTTDLPDASAWGQTPDRDSYQDESRHHRELQRTQSKPL